MKARRDVLAQRLADPRLADAGLARQQHHLAVARAGQLPAVEQQRHFLVTADQRRWPRWVRRLEPRRRHPLRAHAPDLLRRQQPLQLIRAERLELEQPVDQPVRAGGDDNRARRSARLQPRRKLHRLPDDRVLVDPAAQHPPARHHQAAGDADAHLQRRAERRPQPLHRADDAEAGPYRPFGGVLAGAGIAEIGEHAVAEEMLDKAVEAGDLAGADILVVAQQPLHALRIQRRRECRGADQVAEHDGELTPLGWRLCVGRLGGLGHGRQRAIRQRGHQLTTMAERQAKLLEVGLRQQPQGHEIDVVRDERRLVALQAERFEQTG